MTGWLGIRIMCSSEAICLSGESSFSELVLSNSICACWSSTKRTYHHHHHFIEM